MIYSSINSPLFDVTAEEIHQTMDNDASTLELLSTGKKKRNFPPTLRSHVAMSQSRKRYPTVFTFNIKLTSDGYDLTVKPLIDIN